MDVCITRSARRHGITDDDILHAFRNAIRMETVDNVSMLVGPDRSGRLLEVGAVKRAERTTIIHAMPARVKYLR